MICMREHSQRGQQVHDIIVTGLVWWATRRFSCEEGAFAWRPFAVSTVSTVSTLSTAVVRHFA